jgi:hypothetical protein
MKAGKSPATGPVGAAAKPLRSIVCSRKETPVGDERKASCPAAARKGCGGVRSSPEAGHCLVEGAGRFAGNDGASHQDSGSGITGKALRRFGGRSVVKLEERKPTRTSALGREAKFLRDRWTVGPRYPVYAGAEVGQNCPEAKASRIVEAPAIERESVTTGDRRRAGFVKTKTVSIRRGSQVDPRGCATSGNGTALAFPQR